MAIITGNNLDNRLIGTIGNDEYRFPFCTATGEQSLEWCELRQ